MIGEMKGCGFPGGEIPAATCGGGGGAKRNEDLNSRSDRSNFDGDNVVKFSTRRADQGFLAQAHTATSAARTRVEFCDEGEACVEPNCLTAPAFGKESSGKADYCFRHAKEGMTLGGMTTCRFPGCFRHGATATSADGKEGRVGMQRSGGYCSLHLYCQVKAPARHANDVPASRNSVVVDRPRNLDALEVAGWRVGMAGGRHKGARFPASSGASETVTTSGERRRGAHPPDDGKFERKPASEFVLERRCSHTGCVRETEQCPAGQGGGTTEVGIGLRRTPHRDQLGMHLPAVAGASVADEPEVAPGPAIKCSGRVFGKCSVVIPAPSLSQGQQGDAPVAKGSNSTHLTQPDVGTPDKRARTGYDMVSAPVRGKEEQRYVVDLTESSPSCARSVAPSRCQSTDTPRLRGRTPGLEVTATAAVTPIKPAGALPVPRKPCRTAVGAPSPCTLGTSASVKQAREDVATSSMDSAAPTSAAETVVLSKVAEMLPETAVSSSEVPVALYRQAKAGKAAAACRGIPRRGNRGRNLRAPSPLILTQEGWRRWDWSAAKVDIPTPRRRPRSRAVVNKGHV